MDPCMNCNKYYVLSGPTESEYQASKKSRGNRNQTLYIYIVIRNTYFQVFLFVPALKIVPFLDRKNTSNNLIQYVRAYHACIEHFCCYTYVYATQSFSQSLKNMGNKCTQKYFSLRTCVQIPSPYVPLHGLIYSRNWI